MKAVFKFIYSCNLIIVTKFGNKQGGRAGDVVLCFDDDGYGAVVN